MPGQRVEVQVRGIVQGVGFRPFVHRLATELGLTGSVANGPDGVRCDVEGPPDALAAFVRRVRAEAPPLAVIDAVEVSDPSAASGRSELRIVASTEGAAEGVLVPPDVATCAACAAELDDPDDRRYRHPFVCCTDCGPRFTVVRGLPYDRAVTALADYEMCDRCAEEYGDPTDRRFHAQALCCHDCGPALRVVGADVADPVAHATEALRSGAIVALKGLGGYQLLVDATDDDAVIRLRERKRREQKPFALLVRDADAASRLVELDDVALRALEGPEAPIVLAPKLVDAPVAASVAPDTDLLGVMLPATGLHRLLADEAGIPLVCTSGNLADEPIIVDDDLAVERLGGLADVVVAHDRTIERRADDSVVRSLAGDVVVLRRARGFAPRPVHLGVDGPTVLAVGAELKSTICLATGRVAHVSPHLGDLEHVETLAAFEEAIADALALFGTEPALVVHDLHPEYLSTKWAAGQSLAPTLGVQHHHAHLAAVLAEHRRDGPVIGVAFDGLGWGTDGSAWGGEVLVADLLDARRGARLAERPLLGGARAIREPWRMAAAHIDAAFDGDAPAGHSVRARHAADWDGVLAIAHHSPLGTTSMGRLFDAVAALVGVCDVAAYEGQAAMRLERCARPGGAPYPFGLVAGEPVVIDPAPTVRAIVDDLAAGADARVIAGRFHATVSAMVVDVVGRLAAATGLGTVALSGGVFQNALLTGQLASSLRATGLEVLLHRQVPPNDGGISLGQAAIGRARLLAGQRLPVASDA